MAKKLFKERQRVKSKGLIIMLVFLMLAIGYRLVQEFIYIQSNYLFVGFVGFGFLIVCGLLLWYLHALTLEISINKKRIDFKMKPWHRKKHKIHWNQVEDYQILETSPSAQWHGGNITFGQERTFTVCGRNGLYLKLKDGREYFLGTKKLRHLRAAIKKVFDNKGGG